MTSKWELLGKIVIFRRSKVRDDRHRTVKVQMFPQQGFDNVQVKYFMILSTLSHVPLALYNRIVQLLLPND
jgi:hypothetical protein